MFRGALKTHARLYALRNTDNDGDAIVYVYIFVYVSNNTTWMTAAVRRECEKKTDHPENSAPNLILKCGENANASRRRRDRNRRLEKRFSLPPKQALNVQQKWENVTIIHGLCIVKAVDVWRLAQLFVEREVLLWFWCVFIYDILSGRNQGGFHDLLLLYDSSFNLNITCFALRLPQG